MRTVILFLAATLMLALPAQAQGPLRGEELGRLALRAVNTYTRLSIFDEVKVIVNDRDITLAGVVTMPYKRTEIGERVAKIDGVRNVENTIRVLPVSNADAQLRMRVAQAIYRHPAFWQYSSMPNPPIHIIVEHRRVALTGTVNSQVDRMLAFALAQVDGTLGVKNELRVDVR